MFGFQRQGWRADEFSTSGQGTGKRLYTLEVREKRMDGYAAVQIWFNW
jgi:hypothetical protein